MFSGAQMANVFGCQMEENPCVWMREDPHQTKDVVGCLDGNARCTLFSFKTHFSRVKFPFPTHVSCLDTCSLFEFLVEPTVVLATVSR